MSAAGTKKPAHLFPPAAVQARIMRSSNRSCLSRLVCLAALALLVGGCASQTSTASNEVVAAAASPGAAPVLGDVAPQSLGGVTWTLATLGGDEVKVPAEQARPTIAFD